ncbi:hypothetical protein L208DRAFT_1380227 [Tricholoma matsutake]|nr:hypothetical protein L208DRAFT_1380227 [Tricholoma matsutake 945]
MSEISPAGTLLVCLGLYLLLTMMGIPGLWKIVQPAEEIVSLTRLTITEGFKANKWGTQSLVVGVDASKHSIWIGQAQAIFNSQELCAQAGENPELCMLYFRLAHLLKLPVMAMFIFDGLKRPAVNPNMKTDSDMVAIYTAKSVSEHPDVSLMEGSMILFALLSGGDYDQIGLQGCGTHVAYGLARSGLGDSLFHAVQSLGLPDLLCFLIGWCIQLCKERLTNASGYLTQKQPALTRKVPATFPHYYMLFQYVNPDTSWTEDTLPNASHWTPGQLNITKLTLQCDTSPGACPLGSWQTSMPVYMVSHLSTHLSGMIEDGEFTPANVLWIERVRSGPGDVPSYHVELSTYLLITALLSGLHGIHKEVPENSGPHPLTFVWIPASILHMVLPVLVKQFEVKKAQSSKIGHTKHLLLTRWSLTSLVIRGFLVWGVP